MEKSIDKEWKYMVFFYYKNIANTNIKVSTNHHSTIKALYMSGNIIWMN